MRITRETLVQDALHSSARAPHLFREHGVDVVEACRGTADMITLALAEEWCHIRDLDELIDKLQAASDAETAAVGAGGAVGPGEGAS